ncbi:MAG TPA: DUF1127 domain-containing protein [Thermohalobaculum sp.]|nr:DUF1127 domain-containing protein [Thermohalobaculum sp.]
MDSHYIWLNSNPVLHAQLRRANEARSAAVYAAWRAAVQALGAPFRRLGATLRAAGRARETVNALSALSDRDLADIGLHRGEIAGIARAVAHAVADAPPGTGVTLAELPRLRAAAERPGAARRGRPKARAARRPESARQRPAA